LNVAITTLRAGSLGIDHLFLACVDPEDENLISMDDMNQLKYFPALKDHRGEARDPGRELIPFLLWQCGRR
jgi:hypothetical protein